MVRDVVRVNALQVAAAPEFSHAKFPGRAPFQNRGPQFMIPSTMVSSDDGFCSVGLVSRKTVQSAASA